MQVITFYEQAREQLAKIYEADEAQAMLHWVLEDVLLIKPAHLRMISKELDWAEEEKLNTILQRLLRAEPLQYVLGYTYFCDALFYVTPDVLIPRPETEELTRALAKELKPGMHLLDLCCGSGCIGLAAQKLVPGIALSSLDVSEPALAVAARNAKNLLLQAQFIPCDLLQPQAAQLLHSLKAQVWVSNPPYISRQEMNEMHNNVLQFEPHLALFVDNPDVLLFYKIISRAFAADPVAELLFFEISEYRQAQLEEFMAELPNLQYRFLTDMQGKQRMLRVVKIR